MKIKVVTLTLSFDLRCCTELKYPYIDLLGKEAGSQSSVVLCCTVLCELPCCLTLVCCTAGEFTKVVLSTKPVTSVSTTAVSCLIETTAPPDNEAFDVVWLTLLKLRASDIVSVCFPPPVFVLVFPTSTKLGINQVCTGTKETLSYLSLPRSPSGSPCRSERLNWVSDRTPSYCPRSRLRCRNPSNYPDAPGSCLCNKVLEYKYRLRCYTRSCNESNI